MSCSRWACAGQLVAVLALSLLAGRARAQNEAPARGKPAKGQAVTRATYEFIEQNLEAFEPQKVAEKDKNGKEVKGSYYYNLELKNRPVVLTVEYDGDVVMLAFTIETKAPLEKVNDWNRDHVLSRAVRYRAGACTLEADLDCSLGVTGNVLRGFVKRFATVLPQFETFFAQDSGARPAPKGKGAKGPKSDDAGQSNARSPARGVSEDCVQCLRTAASWDTGVRWTLLPPGAEPPGDPSWRLPSWPSR
jgi:hypothetical protein